MIKKIEKNDVKVIVSDNIKGENPFPTHTAFVTCKTPDNKLLIRINEAYANTPGVKINIGSSVVMAYVLENELGKEKAVEIMKKLDTVGNQVNQCFAEMREWK